MRFYPPLKKCKNHLELLCFVSVDHVFPSIYVILTKLLKYISLSHDLKLEETLVLFPNVRSCNTSFPSSEQNSITREQAQEWVVRAAHSHYIL